MAQKYVSKSIFGEKSYHVRKDLINIYCVLYAFRSNVIGQCNCCTVLIRVCCVLSTFCTVVETNTDCCSKS